MKNKIIAWVIAGAMAAGVFMLGYYTKVWTTPQEINVLEDILGLIEDNYVGDFDRDAFIHAAVRGTLDMYSAYYSPAEYDEVQLSREGVAQGRIGISFSGGSNTIYGVSGNSPAERAGVETGGEIVAVKSADGSNETKVENYEEFSDAIAKYSKGEELILTVLYGDEERDYTLAKEDYVESYVWYADASGEYNSVLSGKEWTLEKSKKSPKTQIIEGFAYIKLSHFNGGAAEQMAAALGKMKEAGLTDLILDLRANGGGYMDILTDIAGYLIPGGNSQVVSVARYKSGKEQKFSTNKNRYSDYNYTSITILGDSGTASASEALIGAVLDYDKKENKNIARVIVSKTEEREATYGKGIMQTTFQIYGGAAVKLTTAEIRWPVSGICIHGEGVSEKTDERVTAVGRVPDSDAELLYAMDRSRLSRNSSRGQG